MIKGTEKWGCRLIPNFDPFNMTLETNRRPLTVHTVRYTALSIVDVHRLLRVSVYISKFLK